ncbi:cell division protein ZapB [Pelotalea chapellei]|uniref:Cell division protein ZapB n=1 Tax=Pelotalea chapellei TaxID=44671 RepID=A0ABS5U538_9BACT|nr:cell division protein ZapB [Pelotalea chapellei]MBT1070788.1 cell division protein ZapB [Pelotalea chapellei]
MSSELFHALDEKVSGLLEKYVSLKDENALLLEEIASLEEANKRLQSEREGFKAGVDAILSKLEGV